jgi:hypothetical protein
MMDAFLCELCKRVEEKPWKGKLALSEYNCCSVCGVHGVGKWLRTDEEKKEALISAFGDFFESAKRVTEVVAIAFPERRAMQQHEDGTVTEVEVSLDVVGMEGLFESLLTELKTLTRKVGE